ncbi:MAG: hypothetical protein IH975_08455, partial [Nitrospinae bacterium]|nr:hypothetical protein [Nitrospinota bacterium]
MTGGRPEWTLARRKAALRRSGSLADKRPDIAKQWHQTKNLPLTPHDVTPGSGIKAWWFCDKGHDDWLAIIWNRTKKKHSGGCPECRKERRRRADVSRGGSLAEKHPEIARQWHPTKNFPLTPDDVTPSSHRIPWWVCDDRGHEWPARIFQRTRGHGCPYCRPGTSRLEIRFFCELKALFSNVKWREKVGRDECDIYFPNQNIGIEVDGYPWHAGKEDKDKLKGRRLRNKGIKLFRVRDKRLERISQTDILYKSNEKHISIVSRLVRNLIENVSFSPEDELNSRKYLSSNSLINIKEYQRIISYLPSPPPEKSLAYLHPQLAKEWHKERNAPLTPYLFTPGSPMKVWWVCDKGHEWRAPILNRTRQKGTGCPECANRRRRWISGTLPEKYPEIARQWHPTKNLPLTPDDVTYGSNTKAWWVCDEGHDDWLAVIKSRTSKKPTGCPKCYEEVRGEKLRKAALRKSGSLAKKHPKIAKQWHQTKNLPLTPDDVPGGSEEKAWWVCDEGHDDWLATINSRTSKKPTGCPKCYEEVRGEKLRKAALRRSG